MGQPKSDEQAPEPTKTEEKETETTTRTTETTEEPAKSGGDKD